MRTVLFGPPGAGKGTQARLLSERRDLRHLSTGVIIRQAIRADTPVGREAKPFVDAGDLVPDDVMRPLAEEAIEGEAFAHFVLDGYPRTLQQAEWLAAFLEEHEAPLTSVINLDVPDEEIVERLSQRRVHEETGENYHLEAKPPPEDLDPDLIVQRPDDRPEAIRKRLEVYREETAPVRAFYEERAGVPYRSIDGTGDFEDVFERLDVALEDAQAGAETARTE